MDKSVKDDTTSQEYLKQLKENEKSFPIIQKIKIFAKLTIDPELKYQTKIKIKEQSEETEENRFHFLFVLNDRILISTEKIDKIDKIQENVTTTNVDNPIIKNICFSHVCIYKLLVHDQDKNEMRLQYYSDDFSQKYDLNFIFLFHKDSFCAHHFIKKYYILTWQRIFESTILKNLEALIYNRHFILNKFGYWNRKQERTLLITNHLIFNIEHSYTKNKTNFSANNVKWADSIKAITKIVIDKNNKNKLSMHMKSVKNKTHVLEITKKDTYLKHKNKRDYEFYSDEEQTEFLAIIRKNYFDLYLAAEKAKHKKEGNNEEVKVHGKYLVVEVGETNVKKK